MVTIADVAESLMKIAGNLQWDSPEYHERASLLDSVLNDILPASWCDVAIVVCADDSIWHTWTW